MKVDNTVKKFLNREARSERIVAIILGVVISAAIISLCALCAFATTDTATYYFDSTASDGGNGTQSKPFNSLQSLEELDLEPGSKLLLKTGSIFKEQLRLVDVNGTEGQPITISSYGDGPSIPRIDGCDTIGEGVVYIENCSWITLSDLEICDTATYGADRRGVLVSCSSASGETEVFSGITLDNLYVHNIVSSSDSAEADDCYRVGGIQAWSDGVARFDRLVISNCYIKDVDGVGIAVWGSDAEQSSPYSDNFTDSAHTNVEISNNTVSCVGGSALYARNLLGGVVEHNVAMETGLNSDCIDTFVTSYVYGTKTQYNEGYYNRSESGCTFGAAGESREAIWQYNYSHDNAGGFFRAESDEQANVYTVRYNLSVSDNGVICGDFDAEMNVYNNTFIIGEDTSPVILKVNSGANLSYYNNIVYNKSETASISLPSSLDENADISNNLVYNADSGAIDGLDEFKLVNSDGLYSDPLMAGEVGENALARRGIESAVFSQLKPASPALNCGLSVEGVDTDMFGNEYSRSIGFYCGSGNSDPKVDYELNAADLKEYAYSDIEIYRDIVYGTAISYKGSEKTLTLDIYTALDCQNRNRPLVVMIHGGGLRPDSSKEQSYAIKISKLLAAKGYVVASINYRTRDGADMPTKADSAPALMDAAEDTNTAVEWLRTQADVYGFNPDYIFLAGGSAGGATAVCYAFAEDSRNFNKSGIVAVADLWGGPRDVFAECYDSDFSQDDKFPTIFIHGTGDTTMEYTHSLDTYKRMIESGITASWNPISGAEHSLAGTDDTYEMTVGLINEFFTARLAEKIESEEGYTQPPAPVESNTVETELPDSTKEKIYPNADTYIYSRSAGKYANYSEESSLYVYDSSNNSYLRKTILRFDIEANTESSYLNNTVLHFTVTDKTGISESDPMKLEVYAIADNYWFADEISWKNTPDFSDKIYLGTVLVDEKGSYSIDITNYVYEISQSGGRTVTFLLESNESPSSGKRIEMPSYESGQNAPYLECTYSETAPTVHTVKIQTDGNGRVDISEGTVVNGGSIRANLTSNAGYVVKSAEADTSALGVEVELNGNQITVSGVVADTVVTVYFQKDSSVIAAMDSATVRYNSLTTPVVNSDSSNSENVNPLFLCTKGESGGENNGSNRIIWLSFDISDYDFTDKSAAFEIYCYKTVDFSGNTMPIDVYATTFSDWSSDSFAWSNQPFADGLKYGEEIYGPEYGATKIGSFTVKSASQWYTVDITDYVRVLRLSGFTTFSLVLVDSDFNNTSPMARFVSTHGTASADGASLAPRIITKNVNSSDDAGEKIDLNVTVSGNSNGTVSGYTSVKKNSPAVVEIEADKGYIAQVSVNGTERNIYDGKLALLGADENTKIEIKYVKEHTLTVDCEGQIKASVETIKALDGETVTIVFWTEAGYRPVVYINGIQQTLVNNTLTLTLKSNVTVDADGVKIIQ